MADSNYNKIDDGVPLSNKKHSNLNDSISSSDDGTKMEKMLEHANNEDRLGFVKKVYAILSVQLLITFGFVAIVKSNEDLN